MKNIILSRISFLTIIFTCAALALMLIGSVIEMGNAAYATLTQADCRVCHEYPGGPVPIANRHHNLVGLPVADDTARPFPEGDINGNFDCLSCHRPEWDPETQTIITEIIRDCVVCHTPRNIEQATISDGRITIQGSGLAIVKDSDLVYVDKTDGAGSQCSTDVVSWTDSLIEADSWRYPDGTVCAEPGDIVVVPCTAAEKTISRGVDLDIARFRASSSVKLGNEVKRIQLTVENPNGGGHDARPATLIGVQNGMEVYNQTRMVFDLSGNGRSRFAFPPFTPAEAGVINWTVEILDDDPDDDTATASTNVR